MTKIEALRYMLEKPDENIISAGSSTLFKITKNGLIVSRIVSKFVDSDIWYNGYPVWSVLDSSWLKIYKEENPN